MRSRRERKQAQASMSDTTLPRWRRIAWLAILDPLLALLGAAILLWLTMHWWLSLQECVQVK